MATMMTMKLSLQGLGSVNWDNVDFVVDEELSIPCHAFEEPVGSKSFVPPCSSQLHLIY